MKASNKMEQYYQNKSLAELKEIALKRNLNIPPKMTKNYLIYLLLNSENNQYKPNNYNQSTSQSTSDNDLSPNNTNHRTHLHSHIPKSTINHSTSTHTTNTTSTTQNKTEKKREYSPVLPKNMKNHTYKKTTEKKKKKESFFNWQKIKNLFIIDPFSLNDLINYIVLFCLLFFGIFNIFYLFLFIVFLLDLISTNKIRVSNITLETKKQIQFYLTWFYILICIVHPIESLMIVVSVYIHLAVNFENLRQIDTFLIIFYLFLCMTLGCSPLVLAMLQQHLNNTNSRFIERILRQVNLYPT